MSLQIRAEEDGRGNLWVIFDEDWRAIRNDEKNERIGVMVRDPTIASPDEFSESDDGLTHWIDRELVDEVVAVVRGGR